MLEALILLLFCAFMGLVSVAIVAWLIVTGRILALDSILLSLISLTVGGIFAAIFAWSVHTGEFQEALHQLRQKPDSNDTSSENPSA